MAEPLKKLSVLQAARNLAARKEAAQKPKQEPIAKYRKGGAVERFMLKYPDFDPRA